MSGEEPKGPSWRVIVVGVVGAVLGCLSALGIVETEEHIDGLACVSAALDSIIGRREKKINNVLGRGYFFPISFSLQKWPYVSPDALLNRRA